MWSAFEKNVDSPGNAHRTRLERLKTLPPLVEEPLSARRGPSAVDCGDEDHPYLRKSFEATGLCDKCSSALAVSDMGFYACTNRMCGVLYTESIDASAEWRYYSADDGCFGADPTRCGLPINPLLRESSYGCSVSGRGRMSFEMRKIKKYTDWQSMPYREKARYNEFQTIAIMANNAGISKLIIDDAMRFHKRISDWKKYRGINRDGITAASIYISCRVNKNPRTAKEIAKMFALDTTSATRGCKNAMNIISELEYDLDDNQKTQYYDTKPVAFIDRYCSKLNIDHELMLLSRFVALKTEKLCITPENTPHSIASGVIYLVAKICNLSVSKRDIHTVSNISEVTVNKCYKKLARHTNDLIPPCIISKYV